MTAGFPGRIIEELCYLKIENIELKVLIPKYFERDMYIPARFQYLHLKTTTRCYLYIYRVSQEERT